MGLAKTHLIIETLHNEVQGHLERLQLFPQQCGLVPHKKNNKRKKSLFLKKIEVLSCQPVIGTCQLMTDTERQVYFLI